ncbi:MAG: hypothetical protein JHC37_01020 [Campylobacteraceae bacterium]|jgi:hypothetical protein|nr:hypothetical protein [Campylobacteraceae bacterium]
MKKVFKVAFLILLLAGCVSKQITSTNSAIINKKPLFNLSSLSIETTSSHISGEKDLAEAVSNGIQKRAADTIYFTKFKKGILKLRITSVAVTQTKERNGSFLYFFPSYEKGLAATISYSLAVYSDRNVEIKKSVQTVTVKVNGQNRSFEKELLESSLDEFQNSIFDVSKKEFAAFLVGN